MIRIYAELEAAWTRTGQLEKKLKHMKKQRTTKPVHDLLVESPAGVWVDPPTLQAFQMCLGQLRVVLREFKNTSVARPATAPTANDEPVENMMEIIKTAIGELAIKMNPVEKIAPGCQLNVPNVQRVNSNLNSDRQNEQSRFPIRSLMKETPTSVVSNVQRNLTSTPLSELAKIADPRTGRQFPQPTVEQVHTTKLQDESAKKSQSSISERTDSEVRLTSLKSLKDNLENLLGQFQANQKDVSMTQMNSLISADMTASSRFPKPIDPSGNRSSKSSEYSMDFDSTATSIRSISVKSKHFNEIPIPATRPKRKTSTKSSSTLNMSSIVDLLGDFSLADIGSSTLTPP